MEVSLKVAITGANRGIGLALAKYYVDQGHQVYGICRRASEDLLKLKLNVVEQVDVADDHAVAELASRLKGVELDILINNAGVLSNQTMQFMEFDRVVQQINVNAVGPLRVVSALRDNLKRGSKIAMITSRMGSIADNSSGGYYGYRMAKAALNMAGVSLANDLRDEGIAVALIHPGFVKTAMVGYGGDISTTEAAQRIARLLSGLNLQNSGTFWHSNGEVLPW
ncbi:MAG: SDR family oxidoreductase [Hahellaceae bacterium]|nr:SDR family oxidoreductase [Hahellaceae bacterium]MCP5212297.1 SDR family oxidoreductase [Hahellaceae bacterium]